uniref:Uncharacterized protein n=1 Tax=Klebsiella phage FKP3 TaxID=3231233 RepID=A0AAU8HZQ8_9CAUD
MNPKHKMMMEASLFINKTEKRKFFVLCLATLAIGLVCVVITYADLSNITK